MLQPFTVERVDGGVEVIVRGRKMFFPEIEPSYMEYAMKRYCSGQLVQDAFSRLNADQREFLMTGMTPEEWDEYLLNPDYRD